MNVGRVPVLIACLLASATRASAQSIAPADYLPLAQGTQWQFERVAGSGPADLHLEVTDVEVADTGTRYFISVPLDDANVGFRLEFATDGSLRLRAVKADLNELLDDLPLDPSATADVQFSPPVLLGAASLVPGSAVVQTPIDEVFDADLTTNIGQVDLDVHATGTITATWDPATSPTVTPAGSFPDVVSLAIDMSLTFFEDVFDTDGTVNGRITAVLARNVGFVELDVDGTHYALDRAIVNGMPIGNFPQYEDIVGLAFTVPPLICLDRRALGEASGGGITLRDIRLSQTLYGKGQLDAVLDQPPATGVPISIKGPTKAKADGTMHVKLEGKTTILDQKAKLLVKQLLDPTSTTLELSVKVGKTATVIPIGIVPVVSGDVRISLDGLVDQSADPGNERTLLSNGRLLLGEIEYPIVAKEKLKVKKDGTHKHSYKFKTTDNDTVIVNAEATSTNAADFTFSKLKPKLFKREFGKSKVSGITAEVVQP
jgi:hypothetical protein